MAFQHDSLDPLDVAKCQLYVGRRLAVENLVEENDDASGITVYIASGAETCTSPEQCVHVSKAQNAAELETQTKKFEETLARCQQETFDQQTGRPKLIGRATYVNVIQCPKDGPRPVPAHLELHDYEAGVVCWSDRVAAPGKRSLSANQVNFYPFSAPQPPEAEEEQDLPPTPAPLDFSVDDGVFEDASVTLEDVAGCNFQVFDNTSAVVGQSTGPSFIDLQNVLDCELLTRVFHKLFPDGAQV